MMSDIKVYADSYGESILFKWDVLTLVEFVAQTAASLIAACEDYPFDGSPPTQSPIGKVLDRMGWREPEFTNALLSQVRFLHAFVEEAVERGQPPLAMDRKDAQLVADALARFQEWKTDMHRLEQEQHGEIWGTDLPFYEANWTNHNEKFLALWR